MLDMDTLEFPPTLSKGILQYLVSKGLLTVDMYTSGDGDEFQLLILASFDGEVCHAVRSVSKNGALVPADVPADEALELLETMKANGGRKVDMELTT